MELRIIIVYTNKDGSQNGRIIANTITRIKARLRKLSQANRTANFTFNVRVRYSPHRVKDIFDEWTFIENEFESNSIGDVMDKLSIFCAADEVRFLLDYWQVAGY